MKTIDVNAKEWRDKINGNSYFAAQIFVDFGLKTEKQLFVPFQYGYGDHYLTEAMQTLIDSGFINDVKNQYHSLSRYCREHEIIFRASRETDLKRNCVAFGDINNSKN